MMVVSALVFGISFLHMEQQVWETASRLSSSVLRFHVRADSDTQEAQTLKLEVRDGVLDYVQTILEDASDREQAEGILLRHLSDVRQVAEQITAQKGNGEPVEVMLTEEAFPVRTYGSVTFPAGIYHSLSLEIGEGKGHNWWCVMYPTLCFRDAENGGITEESQEAIDQLLVGEEPSCGTEEKANPHGRIRFLFFPFLNRFFQ